MFHARLETFALALLLACAATGCGSGKKVYPDSLKGSFLMIEGATGDICQSVLDPSMRQQNDLGSDSDRIGMALVSFKKNAEGTDLAADADAISEKLVALEKLAAKRAPADELRVAAEELQKAVATVKAKL